MRGRSRQLGGVSHFWVILDTLNLIVKIFNIYIYYYIYAIMLESNGKT